MKGWRTRNDFRQRRLRHTRDSTQIEMAETISKMVRSGPRSFGRNASVEDNGKEKRIGIDLDKGIGRMIRSELNDDARSSV